MKDFTNKIEKYLRGQMSHEEEDKLKEKIKFNTILRLQVGFITILIKKGKEKRNN